jgi:4-amino-4-deoxy-L-arabinose transferase-like glycosyltransferase
MPDAGQHFAPTHDIAMPRHGLAWLPYLWSKIFFPGNDPKFEALRSKSLFLLLLLPALLLYGSLSFHLFEPDEGRYAEIAREMLVRGEWVVPYLQGEPYLDKPPLLYWSIRISYSIFGVHEWSARLVPALALHITILACYLFARRWLGDRPAFWGALILSLAPGYMTIGRLLTMDGLLTLWVTLSLLAGYEAIRSPQFRMGWWCWAAVACALGVLTKGPVAIALLLPPLWLVGWLTGSKARIGILPSIAFAAIVLAINLPWYAAICLRLPSFASYFLWQHNVVRFLAPFDHLRPIWFYIPILLIGLFPTTLLALPFLRFLLSGRDEAANLRCPSFGFTLLAGGWCVFFFSLSGCKLPTYIIPAFPPLALALGYYMAKSDWIDSIGVKGMTLAVFAVLFAGHNFAIPWYARYRGPLGSTPKVAEYCQDKQTPVVCYPRNCDSVSFYVERDDLRSFRSKETHLMIYFMMEQPRTVVLLAHRHSLQGLRYALPPELEITHVTHLGLGDLPGVSKALMPKLTWMMGETSLGLSDVAVVERRDCHAKLPSGSPREIY